MYITLCLFVVNLDVNITEAEAFEILKMANGSSTSLINGNKLYHETAWSYLLKGLKIF